MPTRTAAATAFVLAAALGTALLPACGNRTAEDLALTIQEEHVALCGNCHLTPAPEDMPKAIWRDHVLPNMAARVGLAYGDYDPNAGLGMEEVYQVALAGVYPGAPTVDSAQWWRVHDYILSLAPDTIAVDTARVARHGTLAGFRESGLRLDSNDGAFVVGIHADAAGGAMVASDISGGLFTLPSGERLAAKGRGPVVDFDAGDRDTLVTVIGGMQPSQVPTGSVCLRGGGGERTVGHPLHRPVFSQVVDLDADGVDEVLVCEFGYYTGALSLFEARGAAFAKTVLLDLPGVIKFEVVDLNGDGRLDIVALASQGKEGVYALYGDGALGFRTEELVRLPPHYGSSWFEWADLDGDGDLDIALANGDNADYSVFAKPYHGVRVFDNDGAREFSEAYFLPLYGATRVAAADYDADGDVDLAVTAFFADFATSPEEGFVYFENVGGAERFSTYTTPGGADGRWLLMGDGDYDGDGDVDLALGSFLMGAPAGAEAAAARWRERAVDVLLLLERGG